MTVNVSDWYEEPSLNISVNGINIAEGCPAGNVNGAIRAAMAAVKTLSLAVPSSAAYMPRTGGAFTGVVSQGGAGGYLYFADAANASGRVFVQAAGGTPPAMSNGDILIET